MTAREVAKEYGWRRPFSTKEFMAKHNIEPKEWPNELNGPSEEDFEEELDTLISISKTGCSKISDSIILHKKDV